jgi:hypothetical protein
MIASWDAPSEKSWSAMISEEELDHVSLLLRLCQLVLQSWEKLVPVRGPKSRLLWQTATRATGVDNDLTFVSRPVLDQESYASIRIAFELGDSGLRVK